MTSPQNPVAPDSPSPSRRSVLRTAAWTVPAITVATAAPAFAVSPGDDTAVGDFSLNGVCGALGLLGPGFVLAASADAPIPAGTTVTILDTGLLAVNALPVVADASGTQIPSLASITALGQGDFSVVLSQPVPAGGSLQIRWLLSLGVLTQKSGTVALPAGYTPGTSAKTTGSFNQTAVFCNAT